MAGLLDNTKPQGGANAAQQIKDPMLQQIEQGVEQQVPPNLKKGYDAIMLAGLQVMFSKETSNLLNQQLESNPDIVAAVSEGIAKLMMIIYSESKGKMDIPAAGLACISLMAVALDYWEKAYGGEVTPEIISEATKETMKKTLEKFGITGDQLEQVMAAGQQAAAGGGAAAGARMGGGVPMPPAGGAQPQPMGG